MKKKMKLSVVLVMMCMTALLALSTMGAFAAADPFAPGLQGDAVMAGAASEATMKAAFAKKATEMNAAISEVTQGKTGTEAYNALSAAYAAGEILGYSRTNDGQITNDNKRSDYKEWEGTFLLDMDKMNAGYDGWDPNSVNWMSYDGKNNVAYIMSGKFASAWESNKKIGSPIGDKIRVKGEPAGGYTEYQNFVGGYFKSVNGGNCTQVEKKNYVLKKDGLTYEEVRADGTATGNVGAVVKDNDFVNATNSALAIYNSFNALYDSYKANGFIVGAPVTGVYVGKKDYRFPLQQFMRGDSVARPQNDDRYGWSYMAFNTELSQAFLLRDEFMYIDENRGSVDWQAIQALGMPVSNDFVVGANRYQNFTNGYVKATGATPSNSNSGVTIVAGKNMGPTGTEMSVDPMEKIGVLSPSVELPGTATITLEDLTDLFVDCYDEIASVEYPNIIPTGLVALSGGLISQQYKTADGEAALLAFDPVNEEVHFLNPAVYTAFVLNISGYGHPTTDLLTVAQGNLDEDIAPVKVQGFKNGYIKVVSTVQYDTEFIAYFADRGYGTIGSRYNDQFKYFESINYSESVGALRTTTSGDDKVPSEALSQIGIAAPADDALSAAFKQAYIDIFNAGYNCGEPSDGGILLWMSGKSGIIKLTFKGGNGTANFWGDNSMLAYDFTNNKVRLVTDKVLDIYGSKGASGNGWPVTDMMINPETGDIVQNFICTDKVVTNRKVYIIVKGGVGSKVENSHFDFTTAEGSKFVPYLDQYKSGDVTLKTFTPAATYALNTKITIDLNTLIENPVNYDITFDTNVAKGTLVDGVWSFTPTTAETLNLSIDFYTAFSKNTFTTTLNLGVVVSKTALQTKYDAVKDIAKGNYTDATYDAFTTARDAAKAILDKANATQSEIDTALTNLNTAHSALVENPAQETPKKGCGGTVMTDTNSLIAGLMILGLAIVVMLTLKKHSFKKN